MKMDTPAVGQASRLSVNSWKRRLPHFQLYNDSRDGCPTAVYYFRDGCPTAVYYFRNGCPTNRSRKAKSN
jgi:hypothetical protein